MSDGGKLFLNLFNAIGTVISFVGATLSLTALLGERWLEPSAFGVTAARSASTAGSGTQGREVARRGLTCARGAPP